MKKIFQTSVYLLLMFALLASFAMPQGSVSAKSKSQIHLHIQGEPLNKEAKVNLVYYEKEKQKGKEKSKYKLKELNFSRHNNTLYKAWKPNGFEVSKTVQFKVTYAGISKTYKPTKVTGNKGTVNYWISVKKTDKTTEEKKALTTFTKNESIVPFVKDVYSNGDGTFTAYWGYENHNDVTVDAQSSRFTSVVHVYNNATPMKKGFTEGRVEEAFKTVFAGPSIVWELTGPDGKKHIATALASNAKSYLSLQPLLKGVYKNVNGTYTAYWGYHNQNSVSVDPKLSQFLTSALDYSQPIKANFTPGFIAEAFKTNFNSTTLSWNLIGPNGENSTVSADVLYAKSFAPVLPTLKGVYDNGDGTYTAYWGYQNQNEVSVDSLESKFTSGYVVNNSQPMKNQFKVGTIDEAFSTVFKGTELTWELTGPDGQKRIVTANSNNAIKFTALQPNINKVINNGDGTYTAVWGYQNYNSVVVNAKYSAFKGNILKNEQVKKVDFKVGQHSNVFETTFKGTELTWELKGPDGVTRVVTAYVKNSVTK